MSDIPAPAELLIQGVTLDGQSFRPSDWAERLCGVMSCFRPEGTGGPNAYLGYSPYVRPTLVDGVKTVAVDGRLRALEPRAYDFVISFARDNNLVTTETGSVAAPAPDPAP